MRKVGHMAYMEEKENRQFGKPRHKWQENIKMVLKERHW
jgi:hypothetical protein